jgi:hypothetical protein
MAEDTKLAAVKLTPERYQRLMALCEADYRTLSDELRWLIDQEWARRQEPRQLVDSGEPYCVEES